MFPHITPSNICNLSTSSTPLHPAPSQTPPHPVARCLSSSSSAPLLLPLLTPSLRALGPPRCPLLQEEAQLVPTYETHSMRYISPRGIYNASATHLNRGTPPPAVGDHAPLIQPCYSCAPDHIASSVEHSRQIKAEAYVH